MKKTITTLFLIFFALSLYSQNYHLKYDGFLDNREYFNPYTTHQTIFGNRISIDMGFRIDSVNSFYGGASYLYEFGSKGDLIAPDITLYYKNQKKPFLFYFGAFPRKDLIRHPRILLTDTLQYFRPNVEGTFLQLEGQWGYQNIWIDWLSRKTFNKEEIFLVGYSGRIQHNIFFLDYHVIMQHIAKTANPSSPHNLRDNGGILAQAGINLSSWLFLDQLKFSGGAVISYDRLRGIYDLKYHKGLYGSFHSNYKGFGVNGYFYKGDGQIQVIGDSFYRAKQYARLDAFLTPYQNENLAIKLKFGFHLLPGNLDYSQKLSVSLGLNNDTFKIFKK